MEKQYNRFEKSVILGEKSVCFRRAPSYNPALHPEKIEIRGAITGFSRHSALRLRQALSDLHISDARTVGITLTVPWQLDSFRVCGSSLFRSRVSFDLVFAEYKAAFNRFSVGFRRMFPHSACVFRHELQQRKMPHCHMVSYFSPLDLPYRVTDYRDSDLLLWLRQRIYQLWQNAIQFKFRGGSVEGFYRSGVVLQVLDDLPAIFRYIGDHTSKHKQAQLGYQGKQWGFISRRLLVSRHLVRADFVNSSELVRFSREVIKLTRFRISSRVNWKGERVDLTDKPFGSKLSGCRRLVSVNFVDFNTSRKLYDWIVSQRSAYDWLYYNVVVRGDMEGGRLCENEKYT